MLNSQLNAVSLTATSVVHVPDRALPFRGPVRSRSPPQRVRARVLARTGFTQVSHDFRVPSVSPHGPPRVHQRVGGGCGGARG